VRPERPKEHDDSSECRQDGESVVENADPEEFRMENHRPENDDTDHRDNPCVTTQENGLADVQKGVAEVATEEHRFRVSKPVEQTFVDGSSPAPCRSVSRMVVNRF
jgi:hypothetical protein